MTRQEIKLEHNIKLNESESEVFRSSTTPHQFFNVLKGQ